MDPGNDQLATLPYDLKHLTSLTSFPKYCVKVVKFYLSIRVNSIVKITFSHFITSHE